MDQLKVFPSERAWLPKNRRLFFLFVTAFLLVTFLFSHGPQRAYQHFSYVAARPSSAKLSDLPIGASLGTISPLDAQGKWAFDADRDRNNHALSSEQCAAAFPDLYREINRAQQYWKRRQGDQKLTKDQFGLAWSQDGGLRAMIYDQQLYIVSSRGLNHFGHWRERHMATLHNIHRALLASPEPIPDIEFSIKIDDNIHLDASHPNATVWNFSRNVTDPVMDQVWLIPDFNFWAYPRVAGSFGDFQRQARDIDTVMPYEQKRSKLIWRGTVDFNPGIRNALLAMSEGNTWSDVHRVNEDTNDDEAARWRIAMPEHCRYQYAVHTEGTTWSGRLKYLLSCHSTILIHPLTYTTHLYHLLNPSGPDQNVVAVDLDFHNLPATMDGLLADPTKSRRIADNAAAIFRDRYFTPAAQTCYFRQLFRVWADMTETPSPYRLRSHIDGSVDREFRGMSFEEYVFWDKDYPLTPMDMNII